MASAATISDPAQLTEEQLYRALWTVGETRFVLAPEQAELWDAYWGLPAAVKRIVCHWSRRLGKSTTSQAIGDAVCRRSDYTNVIHGFPTADNASKVTRDNARAIYATCPLDLQPTWRLQGGFYEYANGSRYYVRGLESESDIHNALGLAADLIIFDEAGFIRHLKYAIQSFAPMLLGRPGIPRMLIISSSARDPYHPFFTECDRAKANDAFFLKPIGASSRYSPKELDDFAADCGGRDTSEWRANYECERVVDTEYAILPEWNDHYNDVVQPARRPAYFNTFVALDLGWHPDLTFAVFGYYHFLENWVVIEDEIEIGQMTTDVLADALKLKEDELWGEYWKLQHQRFPPVVMTRRGATVVRRGQVHHERWQDVDKQIQHDLSVLHDLPINQASNKNPKGQVNRVRLALREETLRIHPRCKRLIAHCSAGLWNKQRNSFDRVDGFGHFDGVSALCIALSHVDQSSNPFPDIPVELRRQDVVDLRPRKRLPFSGFRRR